MDGRENGFVNLGEPFGSFPAGFLFIYFYFLIFIYLAVQSLVEKYGVFLLWHVDFLLQHVGTSSMRRD